MQLKLQANRELCQLLGLYAPTKIAPTTPDGDEPYRPLDVTKLTTEELEVLYRARQRLAAGGAGEPVTPVTEGGRAGGRDGRDAPASRTKGGG